MQVTELCVKLNGKYDENPGQYRGVVVTIDEGARQELLLSSKTIAAIFKLVTDDAQDRAKDNAKRTATALEEAVHGPLLIAAE